MTEEVEPTCSSLERLRLLDIYCFSCFSTVVYSENVQGREKKIVPKQSCWPIYTYTQPDLENLSQHLRAMFSRCAIVFIHCIQLFVLLMFSHIGGMQYNLLALSPCCKHKIPPKLTTRTTMPVQMRKTLIQASNIVRFGVLNVLLFLSYDFLQTQKKRNNTSAHRHINPPISSFNFSDEFATVKKSSETTY